MTKSKRKAKQAGIPFSYIWFAILTSLAAKHSEKDNNQSDGDNDVEGLDMGALSINTDVNTPKNKCPHLKSANAQSIDKALAKLSCSVRTITVLRIHTFAPQMDQYQHE